MTTLTLASEKQVAFLQDLVATRSVDEMTKDLILGYIETETLSRKAASSFIDDLLKAPRKEREAGTGSVTHQALLAIPKSRYAIHVDEIDVLECANAVNGDWLFLEVKEWMSTRYMRKLQGSIGSFNRVKLETSDVLALTELISNNPYKYARQFGELYSCCGSCGAELTDPISRELQLGPECRKKFGM